MVKKVLLAAYTMCMSLFQTGYAQKNFDYSIETEINGIRVGGSELSDKEWVVSIVQNNAFSIVRIKENEDGLSHVVTKIETESYTCHSGMIITELTNDSVVTGIGISQADSSFEMIKWELTDQNVSISPWAAIPSFGNYSHNLLTDYAYLAPDSIITFSRVLVDSNYVSLLLSLDENLDLIETDTLQNNLYVSGIYTFNDKLIFLENQKNVWISEVGELHTVDSFWTQSDTFYSDTSSIAVHELFDENDHLLLVGDQKIDRHPGPSSVDDREAFLAKLNATGQIIDTFYFGRIDTSAPNVYSYLDETTSFKSLYVDSEEHIYFTTTSNYDNSSSDRYRHEPTWINVFKLNSELEPVWQFIYNDDESGSRIVNREMINTPDGGFILFNQKYDYNNDPEGGLKLHILRIKPDGTIYTLDVPMPEKQSAAFQFFPNPASDVLRIQHNGLKVSRIRITDLHGKTVLDAKLENEIDISTLSSGLYLIEAFDMESSLGVQRFVKE